MFELPERILGRTGMRVGSGSGMGPQRLVF